MIASELLPVPDDGVSLVYMVAKEPLTRIDVAGVTLRPGEFVEFDITPQPSSVVEGGHKPARIIGGDPPQEMSFSLPVRTKRGETVSITVAEGRKDRSVWSKARFIAVYETTPWTGYLPAVFREDRAQADFLSRFLGALFVEGERIEGKLDHCLEFIAPKRLPSLAAARFLAGWFNIDLDTVLPVNSAGKRGPSKSEQKQSEENQAKPERFEQERTEQERLLLIARKFLARVLPHALGGGTVASILDWVDAVAEARGMQPDRRKRLALVEGYKLRRLFTLPAAHHAEDPDPTNLRSDWGWLAKSAPLANDPLAYRGFLGRSRLDGLATLGMRDEAADATLLYRLLGSQLWLFVPPPRPEEPTHEEWARLLAPILPAHLILRVQDQDTPLCLGDSTVLGLSTVFARKEATTS